MIDPRTLLLCIGLLCVALVPLWLWLVHGPLNPDRR